MAKVAPRTLSGFMELLPADQIKMEKMMETLRKSYSVYGFAPLDTPVIESAEVLLAKGGGETEKQIYRFNKGDSDLALRFDLTVPLAKFVAANYGHLTFPFRRYQIGKVYRGERAQRGRFREFYQADIDIIGDGKLDKSGPNKVRQLLMDELHMFSHKADDVMDFMAISGTNAGVIAGLERYKGMDELFDEGLEELKTVTRYLADFGVPEENFAIDLSIARGLDYYTGTVYETEMTAHPEIGSICSGGRYDDLAGYYTDKKLPGVGISIGLTRLFYVLNEQGMLSDETVSAPADALVIPMAEDLGYAIAAATALRDAGVRTQLYCEQKKFKAKMSYADKLGIPYVILIGEDEIAENVVAVKNMTTGEQTKLGFADAASLIKKDMDDRARVAVIKE